MLDNKIAALISLRKDRTTILKDVPTGCLFAFDRNSIIYVMLENPMPHVTGVWCKCQPLGIGSPEIHSGDDLVVSFDTHFE